ncbi:MAG: hypothetical protein JW919_03755 [Candidatus Omnitrophica bacterium]|nr:hypothetical protein [Candidatus Omnitrophota bacterium]
MRLNNTAKITIAFAATLIAALAYFYAPPFVLRAFCRAAGYAVSYRQMQSASFTRISASGLKLVNANTGTGFIANKAVIRPDFSKMLSKTLSLDFDLYDVSFVNERAAGPVPAGTDLSGLVEIPFKGSWTYRRIDGSVDIFGKGTRIKEFNATGDDIRLHITGYIYKDNTVDSDITIYFSGKVTSSMPDMLTEAVLTEEEKGWKSLTAHIKGDLKAPAIQVSSRLFRLNIKPRL